MKKRRTSLRRKSIAGPHGVATSSRKHLRRIERQIISVGAEMIVDDVEKNHQPEAVRGVDQRLEIVGRAVAAVRRKRQHAVVAPIARAGKFRDRHQLDGGDAELGEPRQFARHAGEAAEQAGMQFVDDRFVPGPAAPSGMPPAIGDGIDHDARAVDVAGLGARGRVGHRRAVLQDIAIARAGAAVRFRLEPAVRRAASSAASALPSRASRDASLRRRPEAKRVRSGANEICAERQTPVRDASWRARSPARE